MRRAETRPLVGDLTQFASVRRIVLDDGPERGVRALAFSTGGGLDFWALADRSLDIGPLWAGGVPVAWQGVSGFRAPSLIDKESENGQGLLRGFSGLLVTCGLDHIRQPANGHPLHGRLPVTPARLTRYGEDWDAAVPVLFAEGEIVQGRLNGEALRLARRIEAPIGGRRLAILDRVVNDGIAPSPQALLYHINFGWPAVGEGSRVTLDGQRVLGPLAMPDAAAGPVVDCLPLAGDGMATCTIETPGRAGAVTVRFDKATLPYLQLWRDARPNHHVVGIEPCTSLRGPNGTSGPEPVLAPGAERTYRVELVFEDDETPASV